MIAVDDIPLLCSHPVANGSCSCWSFLWGFVWVTAFGKTPRSSQRRCSADTDRMGVGRRKKRGANICKVKKATLQFPCYPFLPGSRAVCFELPVYSTLHSNPTHSLPFWRAPQATWGALSSRCCCRPLPPRVAPATALAAAGWLCWHHTHPIHSRGSTRRLPSGQRIWDLPARVFWLEKTSQDSHGAGRDRTVE